MFSRKRLNIENLQNQTQTLENSAIYINNCTDCEFTITNPVQLTTNRIKNTRMKVVGIKTSAQIMGSQESVIHFDRFGSVTVDDSLVEITIETECEWIIYGFNSTISLVYLDTSYRIEAGERTKIFYKDGLQSVLCDEYGIEKPPSHNSH